MKQAPLWGFDHLEPLAGTAWVQHGAVSCVGRTLSALLSLVSEVLHDLSLARVSGALVGPGCLGVVAVARPTTSSEIPCGIPLLSCRQDPAQAPILASSDDILTPS